MSQRKRGTRQPLLGSSEAARLRLLEAESDGLADFELARLTLLQAVAGIGGLGGMIHRYSPADRTLHLVAANGLTRALAAAWEDLAGDDEGAPAQAIRDGRLAWLPAEAASPAPSGQAPAPHDPTAGRWGFPEGTGLAVVPVPGADGPLAVVSVLTAQPGGPDEEGRAFLRALAAQTGGHLQELRRAAPSLDPSWWQEPSGSRLQQAMHGVRTGVGEWDVVTGELVCDEVMLEVGGLDPRTFDGRIDTWMGVVHPDDLPGVQAALQDALTSGNVVSVEYRVCHSDGSVHWVESRAHVTLGENGEPVLMSGTVWDITETRLARDSIGRVLEHMSDGFVVLDGESRIMYANAEAERLFRSPGGLSGRVLGEAVPETDALGLAGRLRETAAAGVPAGFDVRWPGTRRSYHLRLVPVPAGVTVYIADVTEQRMREEARAAAVRAAAVRAARIAELTATLAQALTVRDVVDAVAARVLASFGATALIVQARDGDRLRTVGTVGYSREALDSLGTPRLPEGPTPGKPFAAHTFVASGDELAALGRSAGFRDCGRLNAWAFLPLIASGHAVGSCVIAWDRPRRFSGEERALLTALSGLVAQALERARLYDLAHTRAHELQRGLLPRVLPSLSAVAAAARYLPAGDDAEVGGDWYDVIRLSSDRVAIVIGDVMGHGLSEAATMGRLRTAIRTLADLDIPPSELLAHLNDLVSGLGDDFYATCLYAVYDPTTRICTFARAGHPPPAIVAPDGTVTFPDLASAPPLGAATPPFDTVDMGLPDGSILVLYTDGLVAATGLDIDDGRARLAGVLTAAVAPPMPAAAGDDGGAACAGLEDLCDALTAALVPARRRGSDDAALLVARTHGLASQDIASWPLPDSAIAAGQARDYVRGQLGKWGLDELVMTTELLVSELVGNVVRHARGPVRLRLLRGTALTCEVSDGSQSTPRIRRAAETDEGGRGLQLVAAMSHRWGARPTATGKCIWTEQLLAPAATAG